MFPASSTTPDAAPTYRRTSKYTADQPANRFQQRRGWNHRTIFETVPKRALGPVLQVKVCDNKQPSTQQNTSRPCVHSGKCPQVASSLETLVLSCPPEKSPFHVLPTGWVWMNRHENETKYDFQTEVLKEDRHLA